MICRGGIVVGGESESFRHRARLERAARSAPTSAVLRTLISIATLAIILAVVLPTNIPPLVESDYAYLLTAANRWYEGWGPATTPPVAPNQPWEWSGDWRILTQWPIGYPAILVALRGLLGVSTLQACHIVALMAAAVGLVGWFQFLRRLAPPTLGGWIVSAVGATSAITTGFFVNPSTDLILVAVMPYMLGMAGGVWGVGREGNTRLGGTEARRHEATKRRSDEGIRLTGIFDSSVSFCVVGLLAGCVSWIRYAGVFLPVGVGAFLAWEAVRGRGRWRRVALFGVGAGLPIVGLLAFNRIMGGGGSLQSQLNLGHSIQPAFSWEIPATAWRMFTDLGYYSHRAAAGWILTAFPIVVILGMLVRQSCSDSQNHKNVPRSDSNPRGGFRLCAFVLLAGVGMLVVGSAFFRAKYDFVGLERYYLPLRPFYFALFVVPLLYLESRLLRAATCVGLILAGSWTIQQDWGRDLRRWSNASYAAAPSGARSLCFEPGAGELYAWVRSQADPAMVVISNYHEFVAMETGIPALPIPPDRTALDRWMSRIAESRGVDHVRVLFVLDLSNGTRDYWLPSPAEVIERFGLRRVLAPAPLGDYLYIMSHEESAVASREERTIVNRARRFRER